METYFTCPTETFKNVFLVLLSLYPKSPLFLAHPWDLSFLTTHILAHTWIQFTLGKSEGRRRRGWQKIRQLDSITDSTDMNLSKLQEIVEKREAGCAAEHEVVKSPTELSNWTTIIPENGLIYPEIYKELLKLNLKNHTTWFKICHDQTSL